MRISSKILRDKLLDAIYSLFLYGYFAQGYYQVSISNSNVSHNMGDYIPKEVLFASLLQIQIQIQIQMFPTI